LRLAEDREKIRKTEEARAQMNLAERDKVIEQLNQQLKDMQRKVEQGSTQLQGEVAEMVGTTRSRVNFFLNKFRKLGFIDYRGARPIKINSALLSVVLHD
jgi:hypothetical protein